MKCVLSRLALLALLLGASCSAGQAAQYRYFRVGNDANKAAVPQSGFALMGGGTDLDEAFRWLCGHAAGGDLLVLRATGSDDYNPYIQNLCHLNSVATLVLPNKAAAQDPFVADAIRHASALFISGGDQANYINFWSATPVQKELNAAIARSIPIGGTSAGLAVLGEWAYSAQGDKPDDPNLDGKSALAHPFSPRITLVRGFLHIPLLSGIITDTHFARRDRMGRLLTYIARLHSSTELDPSVRGLGVDERAAVLLEPDGTARVVGNGSAYFIDAAAATGKAQSGQALSFGPFSVAKVSPGHVFHLRTWTGEASHYTLDVKNGTIHSSQANGAVY